MRVENRKVKFDYQVVEEFEAGIILTGAEVKSIKAGQVNLEGARVVEREGRLLVVGMNVPKYQFSGEIEYDPGRTRELLLHRREVTAIASKRQSAGLTLVPVAVYNKGDLIKLSIGLVRGKKKFEKREEVKKRMEERDLARRLKIKN